MKKNDDKFESIKVGDHAELSHLILQSDIDQFVELTGDDNKLHVDEIYAAKTSYKKPLAHGMLGASFISTVIGTKLPGDGALWFAQNLEFLLPVRVGDTITVKAEVIKKIDTMRILELKTDIYNQENQKVTTGSAKVKIIKETSPESNIDPEEIEKVALVIGGNGGIGKAVCQKLAEDGFDVAVHYHKNKETAEKIQESISTLGVRTISVHADITDVDQVRELVMTVLRKLDTITILVNCSTAPLPTIPFKDLKWETIQKHFDIAIKGAFHLLQFIVPIMEQKKYGKIIHITSQAIEKPNAGWLHYITAKSALLGFSKAMAFELAPKGIRINSISPSMTDTELTSDISEKAKLLIAAQTPLRYIAQPSDIAGVVGFLASRNSDFLTGETIRVNGGQIMI